MDLSELQAMDLSDFNGELKLGDFSLKREGPVEAEGWSKYPREKLGHFPPNTGTYEVSDPASPVAVCIPRQQKELQDVALHSGAAIVGPCVTPNTGVELLITNVVSNPNIRWLLLAGKDSGHLSGDVLASVSKNGIDQETGRVIGTRSPTSPFLRNFIHWGEKGRNVIDRFRSQVKVINLLGCEDPFTIAAVTRAAIQEPSAPFSLKTGSSQLQLYDPGAFKAEPLVIKYHETALSKGFFESFSRVGTSIHAPSVAEAWKMLQSLLMQRGILAHWDSTIKGLSVLATQATIYDLDNDTVPDDYKPFQYLENKKEVEDYIDKYSTWVYLLPHCDVKYDESIDSHVVSFPEKFDYVYGSRLCCYGWSRLSEKERKPIKKAVLGFQERFYEKTPSFSQIVEFHEELSQLAPYKKRKVVDQLYEIAKGARYSVENSIDSYRLYMSLQDPFKDLSPRPTELHPPCFCLYEVFPRRPDKKWQLDTVFFLRAHDYHAFPCNSAGGIKLNKFLADFAGIPSGLYTHHMGSLQLYDWYLDKKTLKG